MQIIHKHAVTPGTNQLWLDPNAKFLSIQLQQGLIKIWVEIDSDAIASLREVYLVTTGGELPFDGFSRAYIGTVQLLNGLVFHAYYKKS